MHGDSEQVYIDIRTRLKERLADAVLSIRNLTGDQEEDQKRMKAAQEEVERAGQDALDELRDTFHP